MEEGEGKGSEKGDCGKLAKMKKEERGMSQCKRSVSMIGLGRKKQRASEINKKLREKDKMEHEVI